VLRSSALRGGPNVFSFFGSPVQIRARHFAGLFLLSLATLLLELALTRILSCVAVVSLWLSGDIDGSAWLGVLRSNPRALGGPAGAEGSRPRAGNLRTRLRSLRGIQLLVHAADTI